MCGERHCDKGHAQQMLYEYVRRVSPSVRLYGLSKVLDDDDRRRSSCVTCPIVVPPRLVPAGSGSLAHELRSSIMTLCTALFVLRCVVVQLPTDRHAPNPNQRTRATSHLAGGWRRGLLRRPCIRRVLCARTSRTSDVASRRPRTSRVGRDPDVRFLSAETADHTYR